MQKHRYEHLNRDGVEIQHLNIHSYEMGLYLVEVELNDVKGFVYTDSDTLKKFKSVAEVKDAFGACRVLHTHLLHQSAYDEMCGVEDDKTDNTLSVDLGFHGNAQVAGSQ